MLSNCGYIRHFVACNSHEMAHFVPFLIGTKRYGWIKKETATLLEQKTPLFERQGIGLALAMRFSTFETRSEALREATQFLALQSNNAFRNELYPVVEKWGDAPLAQLDRLAVPWFGVRAWGLHVNGLVRKKEGEIFLWIGKRAAARPIDPGKLDNMIGGGHPLGLTLEENLCKEAKEEAGIPAELALKAQLTGTLNYKLELPDGFRDDTLFVYDLEVPEDFTPQNTDGEVESFRLMPLAEVADLVKNTNAFKFNCGMIIIDFLVRQGFISPQNAEFKGLRSWLGTTTHK